MSENNHAHYQFTEGKLHKGGEADIEILPDDHRYLLKLHYDIKKKALVPIKADYLKGELQLELPEDLKTPEGYLRLEREGSREVLKTEVRFLERVQIGLESEGLKFEILPASGKWRAEMIYHPALPGPGWKHLKIIFNAIPLLQGYEAEAFLNQ